MGEVIGIGSNGVKVLRDCPTVVGTSRKGVLALFLQVLENHSGRPG